jgi:galactose oxidase
VLDWPVVAIHSHLLPDGRVLTWGHSGDPTVWDPATGAFQPAPNPIDIFCGGHSLLPDGRLLVTGGNISNDHGLPDANLFDYRTGQWAHGPQMARGRWYPTNTALPNGEMVVTSGEDEQGLPNPIPEVWQLDGTWRQLTTASLGMAYYPWMFVAPDGRVFYAGWQVTSMWLDASGTGKWTNGPVHVAKFSRLYGTAVMYEPGKVLVAGGAEQPPVNTTEVIDLNKPSPAWRSSTPMLHARHHAIGTSLPDGKVLVTGGSSSPGVNDATGAVLAPEMWDPATERWTELPPMAEKRLYHSTALLLPDARVLVGGGGQPPADGEVDHFDVQIFYPPYLFNPDGSPADRPQIDDAPANVGYGDQFDVPTAQAASVARVTLVKLGSMTHAFNQSQRFMGLPFTVGPAGVTVTAPANANLAPPGHYMLFLVGSNGTPSVARIVHVG